MTLISLIAGALFLNTKKYLISFVFISQSTRLGELLRPFTISIHAAVTGAFKTSL